MSKRSNSNLVGILIVALVGAVSWLFRIVSEALGKLFDEKKGSSVPDQNAAIARLEKEQCFAEQRRKRAEEANKRAAEEKQRFEELKKLISASGEKGLIFNQVVGRFDKLRLLRECFGYSLEEAKELLDTAYKQAKRARLQKAKKEISKKAFELYAGLPSNDKRASIPDEIKQYVWQRDGGRCVKCQSAENLEFDHIIPVSKGGSNTARNIQIFCQDCNRSKGDGVV